MNKIDKANRVAWELNRAEVLGVIREKKLLSRKELADSVSVSRTTVSGIVADLLEGGVLEEIGEGESTGGRPPIKLMYRPNSRLAIGLVMFNNHIQAALTDMEGNPLKYLEAPVRGTSPDDMLQAMQNATELILEHAPHRYILGIGVGVPGIVDFETGVIDISVSKGWLEGNIPVKSYLEKSTGYPVYVANRSRVAALGEFQVGVGKDVRDLIYLFIGQGIAAGIVINGKLHHGSGSGAGEVGHISLSPEGPICDCGNRGCLEVYATASAILANARARAREENVGALWDVVHGDLARLKIEQVIEAANNGDAAATKVLDQAGEKIGQIVSILINLFAPNMVVIGGPVGSIAGDLLLKPATRVAQRLTLPRSLRGTQIVTGTLGTQAIAIGAAALAINETPIDLVFDATRPTANMLSPINHAAE